MTTQIQRPPPPRPGGVPSARAPGNSIKELFESRREEIAKLVPKHLSVDRLLKVAVTSILKTPLLQKCSTTSLLSSVMTLAEVGLEPGGALGHAYLVPYNSKDGWVCQPIISYKGYIQLAFRSDMLAGAPDVGVICDNDEFAWTQGFKSEFEVRPNIRNGRGQVLAAFCVTEYRNGAKTVVVMTREEIEGIRARSKAKDKGPWVSDWEEMAKKTVVRRASKTWPMTSDLARAQEAEEEADRMDEVVEGSVARRGPAAPALDILPPPANDIDEAPPHDPETGEVIEGTSTPVESAPADERPQGPASDHPADLLVFEIRRAQSGKDLDALAPRVRDLKERRDEVANAMQQRRAEVKNG